MISMVSTYSRFEKSGGRVCALLLNKFSPCIVKKNILSLHLCFIYINVTETNGVLQLDCFTQYNDGRKMSTNVLKEFFYV